MVIENDVFSLIYLNPPYDYTMKGIDDNGAERKEYLELVRNTRYLKEGGVMIYVIPSYRFADKKIARHLANYFENIGVLRFSDEDYDDFRQCVFIGTKKRSKFKDFNGKLFDFLVNLDSEEFVRKKVTPLNLLVGKHKWKIPNGATELRIFYTKLDQKSDYHDAIRSSKGMEQFKARTKPKELEIGGHPILPLNQGQMALLLASGAVNGLLGEENDLHLVQGLEIVSKIKEEEVKVHDSGAKTKIMKERTKRDVSVKIITASGLVRKLV